MPFIASNKKFSLAVDSRHKDRHIFMGDVPPESLDALPFLSVSIRLYLPVTPLIHGSPRHNTSRMSLGLPLSENRPEMITFESRKTLTGFRIIKT
jgi:hypothetical protein